MDKAFFGVLLALIAGLATGVGSCIAFFVKRTNRRFLTFSLGFSGGVMIYISFMELLAEAMEYFQSSFGNLQGGMAALAAFFGGMLIAMLIDKVVPKAENPHEVHHLSEMSTPPEHKDKLMRSGIFFALAIGIHNFPEGMAVFMSGMADTRTAIFIAIAVAIHNIPEGITVSVPIYYATGNRKKAFIWSVLSGLAEPAGALVAWAILAPFLSMTLLTSLFAAVAGIMVYLTFDELLPLAEAGGEHHTAIAGIISGMAIMAVTLIL